MKQADRERNIRRILKAVRGMTFRDIARFLGECPTSRRRATKWNSFDKILRLLWDLNIERTWNKPYLRAYRYALELLTEPEGSNPTTCYAKRLKRHIENLSEYYLTCIQSITPSQFICSIPSGKVAAWLAFDISSGGQNWDPVDDDGHIDSDCSWSLIRRRIRWDAMWNLSVELITTDSEMRREILAQRGQTQFNLYNGNRSELMFYEGSTRHTRNTFYLAQRKKKTERDKARKKQELQARDSYIQYLVLTGAWKNMDSIFEEDNVEGQELRRELQGYMPDLPTGNRYQFWHGGLTRGQFMKRGTETETETENLSNYPTPHQTPKRKRDNVYDLDIDSCDRESSFQSIGFG